MLMGKMAPFECFKNVRIMPNSKCNVNHISVFCQLIMLKNLNEIQSRLLKLQIIQSKEVFFFLFWFQSSMSTTTFKWALNLHMMKQIT
jgi:hypothetical protein